MLTTFNTKLDRVHTRALKGGSWTAHWSRKSTGFQRITVVALYSRSNPRLTIIMIKPAIRV